MQRYILWTLVTAFGFTGVASAQQQMLDLIPADAALAIFLRHPDELKVKGDKFLKDSQVDIGMRPSELFDMALNVLGIRAGIDFDRPGGAMLLRPENGKNIGLGDLEENLIVVAPFSDLDRMAANFGLGKGKLQPGNITDRKSVV